MLEPGEQIDIWVVERALGSGGMGSVYRCHNRTASRILAAVKVLDTGTRRHPEAEARFIREAEILFQLDHPNIVKVRNIRTDSEPPYLEMEFVEGESLESRLQRGALPYEDALPLMEQIASAVAYLHAKGVRHRDIKPANLLVKKDNRIKLVDFGLAVEADFSRITQQGMTFGTVSYAPPEWINPDTLDPAKWDTYAIGIVYYEMLTGRVAFPVSGQGSARQQAMQVIVGKQGHRPLDPGDHFHDDVRQLVREMTTADPAARLSEADTVRRRVAALRKGLKRSGGGGVTLVAGDADTVIEDDDPSVVDPIPNLPSNFRESGSGAPARERSGGPNGGFEGGSSNTWLAPSEISTEVGATMRQQTPMPAPSLLEANTAPAPASRRSVPQPPATVEISLQPTSMPPKQAPHAASSPPARRGFVGPLVVLGAGALALGVVAVGVVAYVAFDGASAARPRPVDIVVTGLPQDVNVGVKVEELVGHRSEAALFSFAALTPGEHEGTWVIGPDCPIATCPGLECPAWCTTGTFDVVVAPGEGPQITTVDLVAPPARPVQLTLPAGDASEVVTATLAKLAGAQTATGLAFEPLAPGRYPLVVSRGTCDEAAVGCWPDRCPPGCASYRGELVVPKGAGPHTHALDLPSVGRASRPEAVAVVDAPRPAPAVGPAPAPPAAPAAAPAPSGGSAASHAVTNAELASWLRNNPDWQRDAAIAANRGGKGYLQGWDGATPPPGEESHAALFVSWHLAAAFCRTRGGLAAIDAEPHAWAESDQAPWIELRTASGKAAYRMQDGSPYTKGFDLTLANSQMGFRCAR